MKVVVLAGGVGSRLEEETVSRPKPMVEIGGRPILWHILRYYASWGHRQFVIALGYKGEEIFIETTSGYTANDKPMSEAIQAMWRDVGINVKVEVVEYSVRAQKNRDKSFKGLWWSDPTSTLRDPDGMMWRLLGPGGPQDYWRHPEFDELGTAARFSVDEKFRGEAYKEMTKIFLEHLPWLPVIQPYEDYGLQKYVEWTANPNQQFEVRRFNLKLRRA